MSSLPVRLSLLFALVLAPVAPAAARAAPRLVVLLSVDQFSADLFARSRARFRHGLARMQEGAVFPAAYHGHAATETCPGHATLMTGDRPARTGIVANDWIDYRGPRPGWIYCMEDERLGTHADYVPSDVHLRVPTLGERMAAADPRTRTVSVAGKDRAAILMGGHRVDQLWFWRDGRGFVSLPGRTPPPAVVAANARAAREIAAAAPALALPEDCRDADRAVRIGARTVGTGRFAHAAGDEPGWKKSPAFDAVVVDLAIDLVRDMRLGRGEATDVLTVGASATDLIGHAYGNAGAEMCIQMARLDGLVARLQRALDRTGVDYVLVVTADHGAPDVPERAAEQADTAAVRMTADLRPAAVGQAVAAEIGWQGGPILDGTLNGDLYIAPALTGAVRARALAAVAARYRAHPQVAAVLTRAEVEAAPTPAGPPGAWSLATRQRAAFDAERSGDLFVFLKPDVTALIPTATGSTAQHGSPWDYDRRVPILFWRRGLAGFEQPRPVETIDIMPTLAALVGLPLAPGEVDGRCLDLDAGAGTSCPQP